MSSNLEVITYGGGDLLRMVFNAISMLFYGGDGNNGFVYPLCVTSALIGGALGISRCFFQSYTDAFLTKYFLPLLVIPYLFIVPQSRVHIIDILNDKPIVVDHVPLLFAKIASLSSYWGYQMTQGIEKVMHTPNDVKYSKTGMLFGADTALDFSRLKLNNATVAQNLHHFTQQCIIYDVALGRYTLDELRKSSDLLSFLKSRTSKVRMIPYVNPDNKKMEFLTCIESIEQMEPLFSKEVSYYTKHEILKTLPITYQTLLNFKKKSEDNLVNQITNAVKDSDILCKEMIVVNAFNDATLRFSAERAKANQRSIYQTAGALAGSSLITMRIVLEALIYASCALILPLSLLPGGVKFIGNWIFLNIWIQLWPPLYGILNYITMLCAQKYAHSILGGISNGYSLFTSAGFQDLALDTAALGGYLTLSVPIISFYLLQNMQSLVHISGSLMTPAHSAATTAASELSTGNYSLANTSVGQFSYDNHSAFQHNSSPSFSNGSFTDNYGTHSVTYGPDGVRADQNPSNLNTSIQTAEAYSQQLQSAQQNAQTQVDSAQSVFSETMGTAQRSAADIMQHVASSEMYSQGYSSTETQAAQESANWITNTAESWGHQHGVSSRESLEYFASMGMDWPLVVSARGGHSENINALTDEARHNAENLFNSKDFQEHYQKVFSAVHNESTNNMTDEGSRFVENYATSMEKLQSTQEQHSSALSELNQISESLNFVQSNTSTVNENLNSEFVNWLHDRGSLATLFDKEREQELGTLRDEFISEKCQMEIGGLENFKAPGSYSSPLPNIEDEGNAMQQATRERAKMHNLEFGLAHDSGQGILSQYEATEARVSHKFDAQHHNLNETKESLRGTFESEHSKIGIDRLNSRFGNNLSNLSDSSGNSLIQFWNDPSNFSWFDDYAKPK